jgi:hypothetical protein
MVKMQMNECGATTAAKVGRPPMAKGGNSMVQEVRCGVEGCANLPAYEVILYDIYLDSGEVFFEQDLTCPYLCSRHMIENERQAYSLEEIHPPAPGAVRKIGEIMQNTRECPPNRRPRGFVHYPHTNKNCAQGFTINRPIGQEKNMIVPGVM